MHKIVFQTFVLLLLAGACSRRIVLAANPVADQGGQLYAKFCATCHGVAGNGYMADNAPSLRTATFLATASDDFLRAGISRGRPGTAMAGYGQAVGGPLSVKDVTAIIEYLRVGAPPRVVLPSAPVVGDAKQGKTIYDAQCLRCHGTRTQRSTAVHLANAVLLETASDAFLRWAIENGRPPTSMVPWKGALATRQIDDVVAYLRSLALPPAVATSPPPREPSLPRQGPVVLNPKGGHATFKLRDDRFVSIDQVNEALVKKQRIVIADARAPSDWLNLRIAGAISTPYYDHNSLDDIPNDGTWVVAYCACPHHVSGEVVDELRKRGFKHTAVLDEGVFAWQAKGYPIVVAPGQPRPPAPPPAQPARAPAPASAHH